MPEIPGIDVLERLGGARAEVHRAVLRRSGAVVVVKHAPWDRPDVTAGLAREAAVLRRVTHRSLVRLLDVVEHDGGRALVLAHAPGGDLATLLARGGPMAPDDVADLGARLAQALGALHDAGVVHRDVAPANVLVDAELVPLLCDLDHALDRDDDPTPVDREVVGTAARLDPRLLDGAPPDPRSDLYALGCVLWEAATGTPPHGDGDDDAVLAAARAGRRPPLPPGVPDALAEVLHELLAGEVVDAADAHARLEAARLAAVSAGATARPSPGPGPGTRPSPPSRGAQAPATRTPTAVPAPTNGSAGTRTVPVAPPAPAGPGGPTSVRGGGAGRGGTRRFGPAPPRRGPVGAADGVRRWLLVLAGLLALLVPAALLVLLGGGDETGPIVAPSPAPVPVTAPPACDGAAVPDGGLLADLDGDGCSEVLHHDPRAAELTLPDGSRFVLGEPGDVLLLGDWDGNGAWTPGLHRPSTGEVFLFDGLAGEGELRSRAPQANPPGGRAVVTDPDDDGTHDVVVVGGDAAA